MQNRAVIISLNMLVDKIDTNLFLKKMEEKAKEKNSQFQSTPLMLVQVFICCEKFNQKKISDSDFKKKILALYGIAGMDPLEFWDAWSEALTEGDISLKLKEIKKFCLENNVLIYFIFDVNKPHLNKIISVFSAAGIGCAPSAGSLQYNLDEMPLYTTCEFGKTRSELTTFVVGKIREKIFNGPQSIMLLLANPEKIEDSAHKKQMQVEQEGLMDWCGENNVSVQVHKDDSLITTLSRIFSIEVAETADMRMAVNQ